MGKTCGSFPYGTSWGQQRSRKTLGLRMVHWVWANSAQRAGTGGLFIASSPSWSIGGKPERWGEVELGIFSLLVPSFLRILPSHQKRSMLAGWVQATPPLSLFVGPSHTWISQVNPAQTVSKVVGRMRFAGQPGHLPSVIKPHCEICILMMSYAARQHTGANRRITNRLEVNTTRCCQRCQPPTELGGCGTACR